VRSIHSQPAIIRQSAIAPALHNLQSATIHNPQSTIRNQTIRNPQSTNPQSAFQTIRNPQSTIRNPQSAIKQSAIKQSAIPNRQSANPQSAFCNPHAVSRLKHLCVSAAKRAHGPNTRPSGGGLR
jgi:hypothetical protein